jgi:hypothetical protein
MSDVNLSAPPPAAVPSAPASAPAAPARETPINPNPVSSPQPIGSQAPPAPVDPDKHKGSPHRPLSRSEQTREAVRKAFERASEPGPAKAKMGHNNPPEAMEKEEQPRPRINLKKPPPPAEQQERPRGEHGHFAPAGAVAPSTATGAPDAARQEQAQAGPAPQAGQPASPIKAIELPEGAPYREAPRRWSELARAEWGAAPESVRADAHRMHKEFSQAYEQMRADHDEMNSIRHYHELAKQHGTTLEKALANYTSMESKLRADPIGGLDVIVNNLNLRTADGQRIGLRDIAWHVLNQSPDQLQSLQMQNVQAALTRQMRELREQQTAIAQATQDLQYERRFAYTRSGVDQFAETHPRLDELGDLIQQELQLGFDLPEAYRRAELLRPAGPATHAAQTRTQTAQTRSTDRSIHGAPDRGPANGHDTRRSSPSASPRDSVTRALRAMNGSL